MSAERGWIGEPQPPKEWHTPSWSTRVGGDGGRHFITPESARRDLAERLAEQEEAEKRLGVDSVLLSEFDVEDDDLALPGNQ